ncbi:MAG: TetR/AcrR family transcriptional regulator, partial [Pseudomonadota bacterium]
DHSRIIFERSLKCEIMARKEKYDSDETLNRATSLFWMQGYHATSMKDLETALDLGPGSIYARFGSKAGVFEAALKNYAVGRRAELEKYLNESDTILEGMAAYAGSFRNLCERDTPSVACMMMKSVTELHATEPELQTTASDLLDATEKMFAEQFDRARSTGELPESSDPAFLGAWFQAEIMGIRTYAQKSNTADRVSQLADRLAERVRDLKAG